jgi:antitoxin MazE
MAEATLNIRKWGNNLGVRLPAAIARAAGLHVDQSVQITVEGSAIVIRPVNEGMNTLEQRLARFDPEKHGGEVMQSERLGAEKW